MRRSSSRLSLAAGIAIAGSLASPSGSLAAEDEPVRGGRYTGRSSSYEAFQRRQQQNYESFQENRQADYRAYMERLRASYERFTGIVEEVEAEEEDRLAPQWNDPELSSRTVWVEYSEDASERRKVDFERGSITIESVDPSETLADPEALRRRVRALVTETRAQAFERDRVAQAVERRSKREIEEIETAEVSDIPVLWPYITGRREVDAAEVELVVDLLVARAETRSLEVGGEAMQQVTIPLDVKTLLAQLDKLQSGGFAAQMPEVSPQAIPRPTLSHPSEHPSDPSSDRPKESPADESSPAPGPRDEASPTPTPTRPMPELPRTGPLAPRQPDPRSRPAPAPAPAPTPTPTPAPRAIRPGVRPSSPSPEPGAGSLPPRARAYLASVREHGEPRGIDRALMFAIIETESAFNPLARSGVPAYGLMQIVPRSAGQDASAVLFGRPRILAPSYLYDAEKNIQIGAIYLDILFNRYLEGIENPRSRLYCAIAAYNTGAGNVFRTFTGRTKPKAAFAAINRMSPDDVYRKLIWRLPYKETRNYLAKVVRRMDTYR